MIWVSSCASVWLAERRVMGWVELTFSYNFYTQHTGNYQYTSHLVRNTHNRLSSNQTCDNCTLCCVCPRLVYPWMRADSFWRFVVEPCRLLLNDCHRCNKWCTSNQHRTLDPVWSIGSTFWGSRSSHNCKWLWLQAAALHFTLQLG